MMRCIVCLAAIACLAAPASSIAQLPLDFDPGRSVRTRADLERLLSDYESALASPAYSESVKRSIRADAERVRSRLRDGDFRVGDRIVIDIQGEPDYPDTVTVQPGPIISLEVFGDVSLAGVLRSEIEPHLYQALGRFIRDPLVRANGLMRISILGAVRGPGFYSIPAETILGDAVMMAGGPSGAQDFDGLRIERAGRVLYEDDAVQAALREGLTLDQLNLQAGDQIVLPAPRTSSLFRDILGVVGAIGSATFLLYQFGIL